MFWLCLTPYDNFELGGTLSYFNLSLTDNLTMTSFLHYSQAFNRRWHRYIFRKYSNNINISEILMPCIAPSWIINEKKFFFHVSIKPVWKAICKLRHWNLGTGIGTDITNVIISSSKRPMEPKLSRMET